MRRVRRGGFTAFNPTIRPNIFSPVGVEDLIERKGESALWFRLQPCPCPPEERTPDCRACIDGYVKSFQDSITVENEKVYCDGNYIYPRFAPVSGVQSTEWLGEGEGRPLSIKRIEPERIQVEEYLEDWHAVVAAYDVDLVERMTLQDLPIENTERLDLPIDGVLIGVDELYIDGAPLSWTGFGFQHITLAERKTGLVNAAIRVFNPIKVAYRTMDMNTEGTERAMMPLETGEVEFTVPGRILMGEGDILTLLTTTVRNGQYIPFQEGPSDRLSYAPVSRILNCYSKETDQHGRERLREYRVGQDLVLESSERVRWLSPKPRNGYTIMYEYHPSFRIQSDTTVSGTMDRTLPRVYKAKAASSYNPR